MGGISAATFLESPTWLLSFQESIADVIPNCKPEDVVVTGVQEIYSRRRLSYLDSFVIPFNLNPSYEESSSESGDLNGGALKMLSLSDIPQANRFNENIVKALQTDATATTATTTSSVKILVNFTVTVTSPPVESTEVTAVQATQAQLATAIDTGFFAATLTAYATAYAAPAAKNVTVFDISFISIPLTEAPTLQPITVASYQPTSAQTKASLPTSAPVSKSTTRSVYFSFLAILGIAVLSSVSSSDDSNDGKSSKVLVVDDLPSTGEERVVISSATKLPTSGDDANADDGYWIEISVAKDFKWRDVVNPADAAVPAPALGVAAVTSGHVASTASLTGSGTGSEHGSDIGSRDSNSSWTLLSWPYAALSALFHSKPSKAKATYSRQDDGSMLVKFLDSSVVKLPDGSAVVKFGSHCHAKAVKWESRRKGVFVDGKPLFVTWARPLRLDYLYACFVCKTALVVSGLLVGFDADAIVAGLEGVSGVATLPGGSSALVSFESEAKARAVITKSRLMKGLKLLNCRVEVRWASKCYLDYFTALFDTRKRVVVEGLPDKFTDNELRLALRGAEYIARLSDGSRLVEFASSADANLALFKLRNPNADIEDEVNANQSSELLSSTTKSNMVKKPLPKLLFGRWARPLLLDQLVALLKSTTSVVIDGLPENFSIDDLRVMLRGCTDVTVLPGGVSVIVRFQAFSFANVVMSRARSPRYKLMGVRVKTQWATRFYLDYVYAYFNRRTALRVEGLGYGEETSELVGVASSRSLPGGARMVTFTSSAHAHTAFIQMKAQKTAQELASKRRLAEKMRHEAVLLRRREIRDERRRKFATQPHLVTSSSSTATDMDGERLGLIDGAGAGADDVDEDEYEGHDDRPNRIYPDVQLVGSPYTDYMRSFLIWDKALVISCLPSAVTADHLKKVVPTAVSCAMLPDKASALVVFSSAREAKVTLTKFKRSDVEVLGTKVSARFAWNLSMDWIFSYFDSRKSLYVLGVPPAFNPDSLLDILPGCESVETLSDEVSAVLRFTTHRDAQAALDKAECDGGIPFMDFQLSARWSKSIEAEDRIARTDKRVCVLVESLALGFNDDDLVTAVGGHVAAVTVLPGGRSALLEMQSHRDAMLLMLRVSRREVEFMGRIVEARWAWHRRLELYSAMLNHAVSSSLRAVKRGIAMLTSPLVTCTTTAAHVVFAALVTVWGFISGCFSSVMWCVCLPLGFLRFSTGHDFDMTKKPKPDSGDKLKDMASLDLAFEHSREPKDELPYDPFDLEQQDSHPECVQWDCADNYLNDFFTPADEESLCVQVEGLDPRNLVDIMFGSTVNAKPASAPALPRGPRDNVDDGDDYAAAVVDDYDAAVVDDSSTPAFARDWMQFPFEVQGLAPPNFADFLGINSINASSDPPLNTNNEEGDGDAENLDGVFDPWNSPYG